MQPCGLGDSQAAEVRKDLLRLHPPSVVALSFTTVGRVDLDHVRLCSHADMKTLCLACAKSYHGCIF